MNLVVKEFKNNKEAQNYFNQIKCDNIFNNASKHGIIKLKGFSTITIKNNKITIKSEIENENKLNQIINNI